MENEIPEERVEVGDFLCARCYDRPKENSELPITWMRVLNKDEYI
jgi:hypothetical protein